MIQQAVRADSDLMVVRELRQMSSSTKRDAVVANRAADDTLKWLDWPEYLQVPHADSFPAALRHLPWGSDTMKGFL